MGAMLHQVSTLLMLVGLPHRPFCAGIGRPRTRAAGEAFERGDQRGLFAADECARALHQFDVEVEAAAEDVLAQQPVFARLFDGAVQAAHRQRILGAHVDDALGRAHRVGADDHAFQQRMRIALDLVAVHVGAGIALVGIADDVLGVGLGLGQEIPLVAGEEARAAAAAQPRGLDLLDHRLPDGRRSAPCRAPDSRPRAMYSSMSSGLMSPQLRSTIFFWPLKNGMRVPGRDLGIALPVFAHAR